MTPDDKPNPFQGKTGRTPPYEIPKDAGASEATFTGTEAAPDPAKNETRYRFSPDMDRQIMVDSFNYHEAGEEAAYVDFGSVKLIKGGSVYPDAVGIGEGEATPFSAQRGEMPSGEGGKMLGRPTGGMVQAMAPVKSDVPANR